MISAGIGCRRGCPATEIISVLREAEHQAGVLAEILAAPAFKLTEPGLSEAAHILGLPLIFIENPELGAAQPSCFTRSGTVLAQTGLSSVAEASALVASGRSARLLVPRITHPRATCAIAVSAA